MANRHHNFFIVLLVAIALLVVIVWKLGAQNAAIIVSTTPRPLIASAPADIPIALGEPLLGNPGAPLTLVAFVDLSDKTSVELYRSLASFVANHPKDARLVWKDYPTKHLFGANNTLAHQAAWCAGKQNHFWDFIATTTNNHIAFSQNALLTAATSLGIDGAKYRACLEGPQPAAAIASSIALAQSLGFRSAPALFANNMQVDLTQRVDLTQLLNSLIAP